jgi:uncharacterized Tic20 family protein
MNVTMNATPGRPALSGSERRLGVLCHLAALAGLFLPVPFEVIGPLVVWLLFRADMPFVDREGRESANFQITMLVLWAACLPLVLLVVGIPMIWMLKLLNLLLVLVASIRASQGESYRYPFALRFL